jgi:hypothetical protein
MKTVCILLLVLIPTIQYRFEVGSMSFAFMEPVAWIACAILLSQQLHQRGSIFVVREAFIPLLLLIIAWSIAVRPLAANTTSGLSDIRDWLTPVLIFVVLISTVRTGWRTWIGLFLVGVVLQATLGIYQRWTDSTRPFVNELAIFKTGFILSPETGQLITDSYAVGLFTHPNNFAIYLFSGLMILMPWPLHRRRWLKWALIVLVALSLYWSFAKASLIVMVAALIWYILLRLINNGVLLLIVTATLLVTGSVATLLLLRILPEGVLSTLYWRFGLWAIGLQMVWEQPVILLFGNGLDHFISTAYYGQPHNVYFYMLLQYGLFGLFWFTAVGIYVWLRGWQARSRDWFAYEPRLAGIWIALLGFFGIGLVESNVLGIENRTLLLLMIAFFSGLAREVHAELRNEQPVKERIHVGTPLARPRAL